VRADRPPAPVLLSWAYAGYAALAAAVLLPAGGFAAAAATVTAALGVGHLLAGVLARRAEPGPGLRRAWIAAEALLVPVQFGLSVASSLVLVGMALSAALLAALRPRFGRLRPTRRKVAVTLHVGLSVGWLGVATCMLALSVAGLVAADAGARRRTYQVMHVLDLTVVVPLVLLSVASGLVVSLWGRWGLVRHWWVLAKLGISLAIPLGGGSVSDTWITELAEAPGGDAAVPLVLLMAAFCAGLWTATALSVFKPWGRTPWAQRRPARVTAPA
jgi:hypothetical protein